MKTNYLFYLKFMLLLLFMGGSQLSKATIRYVKANGTGDGSTWELASPSIGSVLSLSKGNDEIWVAAGEYAATSSITMKVRVKIYGGFPATGTPSFSDRNWKTNQTKLKANGNTIFNNNLLINSESILDGFYLTGANVAISNTNGASPTITNCYFESNTNGAINNYSSDPIIFNCIFKQNSSNKGGAIYNESSSAVIKNCIFDSNSTADGTGNGGGAIYLTGNNVNTNITNCIFVNNTASRGADIYSSFGSVKPLTLLNCSFYNNKQQSEMLYLNQTDLSIINTIMIGGTAINNFFVQNGNAPTVRYSLLSKSNSTTNGNIDYSTVDVNSLFVNINKPLGDDGIWGTADDGLALSQRSILINKGDNASYGSSLNTDLDPSGNIRKQYNIIDIGAYESPFYPIPVAGQNNVVYVKKGGAGNCFGTSWDNATPELSIALMAANTNPNIKEIWVAAGTYYPSYRGDNMDNSNVNDFDNTFLLVKDVKIYGGFVGTETANTQSNPAHNPSILSGDLGVANDATDNAYHVVVSANDVGTASLNGFTITGGNAINNTQTASVSINNNIVYRNNGGGIYIVGSSPVFKNVKIENNVAKYGGGIYMDLGSSKPSIVNSLLTNNIAKQYGGAICTDRSSYTLINSTVTKNMGDVNAGGISNSFAESKPQIINSIIWANTKVDNVSLSNMVNSSAVPTISNSIMQESGSSNWQSSFGVDGGNNLDVDPSFSDVANRDFSLQADSPAINQGSNELYISNGGNFSTDKDLADNPRLVGSNIDMGAFERQCNTPAPTSSTNVSCNGGSNGTASVVVSGGASGYTYLWSPSGGTAATAVGLAAGTYAVTVTDANACAITRSVTITQPTALSATTSSTNVSCNGGANGTASVAVSGGTSGYTYLWSPSGGTAATATGLVAGTYAVTVTDANACTILKSVTITQPTALTATASKTDVSCNGGANGTASVVVSGGTSGYTYLWSPSGGTAATATGLVAGTYAVTVTDANACTITRSVTITQPAVLTATASKTDVSCNGGANGTASVAVSGGTSGYTYSWSPSGGTAATATGLVAGTYTCTITDAKGCVTTKSVTITEPTAVSAPIGDATQSFNQDDTLAALVVNGQNIKWYASQTNAQTHTNALPSSTIIVNSTTYYATQTIGQCESTSSLAVKAYNATLAVGVNNKIAAIQLFPNPVKDILNLKTDEKIESVDVFGIDGKKLINKARVTTNNQLDVHNLAQGTYIIQVKTETKTEAIKFIKQ